MYDYDSPKGDVYGFFVFAFVGAAVSLIITKGERFWQGSAADLLISGSLMFAVYFWPGAIFMRVVFTKLSFVEEEWSKPKVVLFSEAIIAFVFGGFTTILFCFKAVDADFRLWRMDDEVNGPTEPPRPNPAKISLLCQHPCLWRTSMLYFAFRYFFVFFVYTMYSFGVNLYFVIKFHQPNFGFNEYFFLGFVLVTLSFLLCKFGREGMFWGGGCQVVLVLNSILICFFIAVDIILVDLLLGSLIIYLSALWDMLHNANVDKTSYEVWGWFKYQYNAYHCGDKRGSGKQCKKCTPPRENAHRPAAFTNEQQEIIKTLARDVCKKQSADGHPKTKSRGRGEANADGRGKMEVYSPLETTVDDRGELTADDRREREAYGCVERRPRG